MEKVVDKYGRSFSTLRISLTSLCNLACSYCVPQSKSKLEKPTAHWPSPEAILANVSKIKSFVEVKKIRLTGGEPTLYPFLIELVASLKIQTQCPIHMTTNGYVLQPLLEPLKQAGLEGLNVSLDTLNEETFTKLSARKGLPAILEAIQQAVALGFNVKLNMVVVGGVNEQEILPMLEYAMGLGVELRYLEVMEMGHLHTGNKESIFVGQDQILESIQQKYRLVQKPKKNHATGREWQLANGYTFGIIANTSTPFCSDCDRLRLDSQGNIFGCLSKNEPISLRDLEETEVHGALVQALAQKQPFQFVGSDLRMLDIGG